MFPFFNPKQQEPQNLGQYGELCARKEYENRGYLIVAANFYNKKGLRKGEIDFIAIKATTVVFVEVKTRNSQSGKFGTPAESVNVFKQQKLLKAVKLYLLQHPEYRSFRPQIDVCVVIAASLDSKPESVIILSNAVEDYS